VERKFDELSRLELPIAGHIDARPQDAGVSSGWKQIRADRSPPFRTDPELDHADRALLDHCASMTLQVTRRVADADTDRVSSVPWGVARSFFVPDHRFSLRDIFVARVQVPQWQAFLDLVHEREWFAGWTDAGLVECDGLPGAPSPLLKSMASGWSWEVALRPHDFEVSWHGFSANDLNFTVGTDEVSSESRFNALVEFVAVIAERTRRQVVIGEEGSDGSVDRWGYFLTYDPGSGLSLVVS